MNGRVRTFRRKPVEPYEVQAVAVKHVGDDGPGVVEMLGGPYLVRVEKASIDGPGRGTKEGFAVVTGVGRITGPLNSMVVRYPDGKIEIMPFEEFHRDFDPKEGQ